MIWLFAVLAVAVTVFVQLRLPRFVQAKRAAFILRTFLVLLGIAVAKAVSVLDPAAQFDVSHVLWGVGLVHVPAAAVLLLKGWRGEGKS